MGTNWNALHDIICSRWCEKFSESLQQVLKRLGTSKLEKYKISLMLMLKRPCNSMPEKFSESLQPVLKRLGNSKLEKPYP